MEKVNGYTKNPNIQMLISLMQAHGVKRVIVSPGGTHNEIVVGFQYNGNFEMYSTVDERGAAYMAVGMAAESKEPVAIICTESVASRNYFPALTEAYYRQLPILVITGVHHYNRIGHLYQQVIDRSVSPNDTFRYKVQLPVIEDFDSDVWQSNILINEALLELRRHGGGPVHIDLPRSNEETWASYSVSQLFETRIIRRYFLNNRLPAIPKGKIAIYIGVHSEFSRELTQAVDHFCASHNAVVFCSHATGYRGEFAAHTNLLASQSSKYDIFKDIELLIHIGGPIVDQATANKLKSIKEVWRINPDGEIRDWFKKLSNVFEMEEQAFFEYYANTENTSSSAYLDKCTETIQKVIPTTHNLPFSNAYVASYISNRLPENSLLFLGGSLTLQVWEKFPLSKGVTAISNMGTRGIDGVLSSFLGASFVNLKRLSYCVLGDLTFFYDMNALGNRDIGNNVRILLINNNGGGLFKTKGSEQYNTIGDKDTDLYIAAAGHFGVKSSTLVRGYAESLGFEYMTASNKEEFEATYKRFITPDLTEKPMLFEIFTNDYEERNALNIMCNIDVSVQGAAKQAVKKVLGQKGVNAVKKLLNNDKKS